MHNIDDAFTCLREWSGYVCDVALTPRFLANRDITSSIAPVLTRRSGGVYEAGRVLLASRFLK